MRAYEVTRSVIEDAKKLLRSGRFGKQESEDIEARLRFLGASWAREERRRDALEKAMEMELSGPDVDRVFDVASELEEIDDPVPKCKLEKLKKILAMDVGAFISGNSLSP